MFVYFFNLWNFTYHNWKHNVIGSYYLSNLPCNATNFQVALQCQNYVKEFSVHLRLQSFPTFGSGHRQRLCSSQIAFPGQSLSKEQVTTPTHLVCGSGSGTEPSGHSHLCEPGMLWQSAPVPHASLRLHSLISENRNNRIYSVGKYFIKKHFSLDLKLYVSSVSMRFRK